MGSSGVLTLVPHFLWSAPVTRLRLATPLFAIVLSVTALPVAFATAQTANSNAGLAGGQDRLFDAILATPNRKTPVPQGNTLAAPPRAGRTAPTSHTKTKGIDLPPAMNSTSPGERP
jgi:hypothetical protein